MAGRKLILICQSGGKFVPKRDGYLSYTGGEAHAVDVNPETRFDDLKLELAEMWNINIKTISVKYFLPSNRRTLITLSNDKDLQRMIDFHGDSVSADVFVVEKESVSQDKSKTLTNRENRTIVTGSANSTAPSTAATTALAAAAAVATQIVAGTPPETVPDVNTTVLADSPTAIPTGATSTPVMAPAATTASSSGVAANASTPITSPCIVGAGDNPVPTDDVIIDNAGKKRRTASWKIGANGFTIVSIADDVGQQVHTGSKKVDCNGPNTVSSDADPRQEIPTASSELVTDGFMETKEPDSNPSLYVSDDIGKGQQKLMDSWKNGITSVGQEFKNVHEFRDVLRKYAIANHFMYQLKKNDTDRVSAKCRGDGCPWRIHASWVPAARAFKLKKFHNSHASGDACKNAVHPQATKHWLATLVKETLQDSPHSKPKEIVNDICRDFGIELNYSQAWRGMHMAREQLRGSYKDAYNQLPWFCEKAIEANPGSVAKLTTKDDLSFERVFVCFHASLHGFENGCRPLIFLDATSLRSNYIETLLVATAVDGNDGAFPVAFAVVDVEDEDTWHWFLEQLQSVLSASRSITFISDKNKGLGEKVHEVFENAQHGYCIHHLLENFKKSIKGPFHGDGKGSLQANFLAAAHALRPDGFTKCTERIKAVSLAAYDWLMNSEPQFWASHQFKGEQYNHITVNVVRPFDDWIAEARKLPIVQKIDAVRCKMTELINTRRIDSSRCASKLAPCKEEKLQEESIKARAHKVLRSSDSLFEVHDDFIYVVNMDLQECSCQRWKITGLPCSHAIAVFNSTGRNHYDYCSRYFTTEALQLTYSESINPLPEIEKPVTVETSEKVLVHPPRTRTHNRPGSPGRLKRKRTNSQEVDKRPLHCSKCKGEGHNKASCKPTE